MHNIDSNEKSRDRRRYILLLLFLIPFSLVGFGLTGPRPVDAAGSDQDQADEGRAIRKPTPWSAEGGMRAAAAPDIARLDRIEGTYLGDVPNGAYETIPAPAPDPKDLVSSNKSGALLPPDQWNCDYMFEDYRAWLDSGKKSEDWPLLKMTFVDEKTSKPYRWADWLEWANKADCGQKAKFVKPEMAATPRTPFGPLLYGGGAAAAAAAAVAVAAGGGGGSTRVPDSPG